MAIEYMLLLSIVVLVSVVGFRTYMTQIHQTSNVFFDKVANGVMGPAPNATFIDTAGSETIP